MSSVSISDDRLKAYLTLEGPVDRAAIDAGLLDAGVVQGIDPVALKRISKHGTGGKPECIANGIAPKPVRPARIELDADTGQQVGAVNKNSLQIDYRERGGVISVAKGDRIGVLLPAELGEAGVGVDGEVLETASSGEVEGKVGPAVHLKPAADGKQLLIAGIDGVVRTSGGEVYVSDLLEIAGDVDLSVGNITVRGSVHVKGNVRSGFRVQARNDIDVDEAIEDAHVEAGKTVTVREGILGRGSGVIKAGGNVRAKFAQNSTIRCGGDVVFENDTNSNIECGGRILAREGAGQLRAGTYWAGKNIHVSELGSTQGVPTRVRVGGDPALTRELARARMELRDSRGKVMKLQRQRGVESARRVGSNLTPQQAVAVRRAMGAQRETEKANALLVTRVRELEAKLKTGDPPYVRVDKAVHAGVKIQINESELYIDHTRPGGTFRRNPETGEITTGR